MTQSLEETLSRLLSYGGGGSEAVTTFLKANTDCVRREIAEAFTELEMPFTEGFTYRARALTHARTLTID
jgi:hypothetical protein